MRYLGGKSCQRDDEAKSRRTCTLDASVAGMKLVETR